MNPDLFCKAEFLCVVLAESQDTPMIARAPTEDHMVRMIHFPDLTLAPKNLNVLNFSLSFSWLFTLMTAPAIRIYFFLGYLHFSFFSLSSFFWSKYKSRIVLKHNLHVLIF